MTKRALSRRDFLKAGGLALGSLAFSRLSPTSKSQFPAQATGDTPGLPDQPLWIPFPAYAQDQDYGELMRVAIHEVDLHAEANDKSEIIGKRYRDQLVHVYYELEPPDAPAFYNKLWYRVWGGYLHSSYLQPVQIRFNPPLSQVRQQGQLCEVTVPFTQSYSYNRYEGWRLEYRLYYETTHWITGIDAGPNGLPWYRITDELQPWDYFVPAEHLRPVTDDELAPISPDVPADAKHIEVDLTFQRLRAYENDKMVLQAPISSGIPGLLPPTNGVPSETPKGRFNIYSKMPSKHMGDGRLMRGDLDLDAYELVGVPWTSFFHKMETGYAFHGTYWHNNFGWQMSHGCVNMRNADAKWLFRWSTPVNQPSDIEKTGYGTAVHIY
jgi:lipoprotein-anchoring transpeptidase ErfK/SrfK